MKSFLISARDTVAGIDPMTAAVLCTLTVGVFGIIYVVARFFAEGSEA